MYRFKNGKPIIYYPSSFLPPKVTIEFKDRERYGDGDRGINWCIRKSEWSNDYFDYIIEATINPKILAGIKDYLTAATYNDIDLAAAHHLGHDCGIIGNAFIYGFSHRGMFI